MKIYIAGGMSGVPERNRPAFQKYTAELRAEGHTVFSPDELGESDFFSGRPERDALAKEMWWICQEAEAIAMIPGWETSPGANAEHRLATALKLKFIYLD